MAQHLVSKGATARIAVVGAESTSGTLLRAALAESHVPGSRVNLYGLADGEAVISEYDGEARLIQDPNLREIVAHEVIFLSTAHSEDDVDALATALIEEASQLD